MALEGAQGGDAPADRERTAESRPGRDGAAAAPLLAPRRQSRSQSFAYETKAFQGENLTYAILTQPSQGWVTNNGDGTFSFDPGLDFRDLKLGETRRISFSYQVSDGWSGTETESVTLTVTGGPEGTLTIEVTAGNAARRSGPPRPAPPADGKGSGGMPPDLPAAQPAEAIGGIQATGFADDPIDAPAVARGDAESAPPDEAADGAVPKAGMAGGVDADAGGPDFGPAATFPAMASREPGPEESAEASGPETETRDPLRVGAGTHPGRGDESPLVDEEVLAPSGLEVGPQAGPEIADAGPAVPAEFPLGAEDDTSHVEPHAAGLEPNPVEPEPEPGSDGRQYTILAQPSEGRVAATGDGGFDFTPSGNFPDLAVGELEQVSFTCEATDADGAKSIVIASLTVTGTSDGPEVCDVAYRQAQGKDATQHARPWADDGQSDTSARGAERDPVADVSHWPEPAPAGLAMDGEGGQDMPGADVSAEPGDSEFPAVASPGSDERTGPPELEPADETPGAALASPSWQLDPEVDASLSGQDPVSGAQPSTDAIAAPDGGGVPAANGPYGNQKDDTAPWETAAAPPMDGASMTDGGETLAEREPYLAQPVEPAAWDPASETPAEAADPPLRHRDTEAQSEGRPGPDPKPANEILAERSAPPDSDEALAMAGLYDEPQAELPATDIAGDDDRSEGHYRGAVAARAVATLPPDNPDAEASGQPEAILEPEAMSEDLSPGPAGAEDSTAADIALDAQVPDLDDLFGAADAGGLPAERGPDPDDGGAPTRDDDRETIGSSFAAQLEPPPNAMPDAGPEAVADALIETVDSPIAAADDKGEGSSLTLVEADEVADRPAELSDFVLSQDTVVEKSEIGTVVGQVLVTGAEQGSRFIFDLQDDAGGRFDVNPRTGQITVADGALLDHLAADSHDIMVQVIAHSGVSCRKALTIGVLPAGAGQAAGPPAAPPEETDSPALAEVGIQRAHALQSGIGHDAEAVVDGETYRPDDRVAGGGMVDTLHLDGVSGGPGLGGWALELDQGEIVETDDDSLMLSENSAGNVILDGCPVKVAFEGVERIEW